VIPLPAFPVFSAEKAAFFFAKFPKLFSKQNAFYSKSQFFMKTLFFANPLFTQRNARRIIEKVYFFEIFEEANGNREGAAPWIY